MQDSGHYPTARTGEDEIDLVELAKALWAQKLIIVVATVACTAIALGYALLSTPVYEAKATVLPPLLSDIAAYNSGRGVLNNAEQSDQASFLKVFTVDDVYGIFTRNLNSQSLRRKFFQNIYLPSLPEDQRASSQDKLWSKFNELISIKSPDKLRPEYIEITVRQTSPSLAADWANQLIDYASLASREDMKGIISAELEVNVQAVKRRIASLRSTALQRRMDRIAILKEALSVANAVGAHNPQATIGRTPSSEELSEFVDGSLTYMRGAKAIEAEMKVLEARQSDDPFVPELRNLQEQLSFLKSVNVQPENVSTFTLDSAAEVPETPVKPKKALVVALGVVLGGMLGVFLALIRYFFRGL